MKTNKAVSFTWQWGGETEALPDPLMTRKRAATLLKYWRRAVKENRLRSVKRKSKGFFVVTGKANNPSALMRAN